MSQAEGRLEDAKGAYPFNSASIAEAEYEVEDLQQILERLKRYETELFGTPAAPQTPASAVKAVKSKATTPAGIARAKKAGLIVDEEKES